MQGLSITGGMLLEENVVINYGVRFAYWGGTALGD